MGPLGEDLWEDEEEEMQKADRGCLGLPTHKGFELFPLVGRVKERTIFVRTCCGNPHISFLFFFFKCCENAMGVYACSLSMTC